MKKFKLATLFSLVLIVLLGCGSDNGVDGKNIDELKVSFVPSAPAEDILTATAPLEDLIKDEMGKKGYNIGKVSIDVGTNYEAVGESLASGTTDIGFIPGGTYVLYADDGVEPILTATRDALSIESDKATDWNENEPTKGLSDEDATFYRSLLVAGPSDKGRELADKVNSGKELTFEDLNSANICLQSPSSSSGYLYPAYMLDEKLGKKITDLSSTVTTNGYGDALGRLAAGQCDLAPIYADARRDYEKDWTTTYNRTDDIWAETDVVAVTDGIMNDTISISKNSPVYSEDFVKDFQEAMINIAKTDEGKKVIDIYSHKGYMIADPSDYDVEREVQEKIVG